MNNSELSYCRLCAELKPQNKLTDLQYDDNKRLEINLKLTRLNSEMNFENLLPKTVCFVCIQSLEQSFNFVTSVEQAQEVLNKITIVQQIKNEDISDNDSLYYDSFEADDNNINIKTEDEKECEIKPTTSKVPKKEKISSNVDSIPLSQINLTWQDYSWKCAFCETEFPSVDEMKSHLMQYHDHCNAFRCTDCNIRKFKLSKFIIHVRRHRHYLKFSCYICNTRFGTLHEGHVHALTHIQSKLNCAGCNMYFENQEQLNQHCTTFYKAKERKLLSERERNNLTCKVCNKTYKTKSSLYTHTRIHTERTRSHTCEVCGKCFLNKQALAGHLTVHSETKPFQCKICKLAFKTPARLLAHIGVHDNLKPFACEQCGRCFRLKRQLKSHTIIHTDKLPYVCTYCNKSFRFKTILNQHVRQHTGVKPYSCDMCQRDFTNWPNYNKHMKRKHGTDMAKKKHTPDGVYPIDPVTGNIVYPEMENMSEWKKKVIEGKKRGRPNKNERNTKDIVKGAEIVAQSNDT